MSSYIYYYLSLLRDLPSTIFSLKDQFFTHKTDTLTDSFVVVPQPPAAVDVKASQADLESFEKQKESSTEPKVTQV